MFLVHYLILMDDLRQNAPWIAIIALGFLSAIMIWSSRTSKGWKRRAMRFGGIALLGVVAVMAVLFGFFATLDPPRQHFSAIAPDGSAAALLSHSELRDGASTVVTVAPHGCCSHLVAYRYFGDGDDYAGPSSIKWIDNNHLSVEYVRDLSETQQCESKIGNIVIICIPRLENLPSLRQQHTAAPKPLDRVVRQ